MAISSTPLMTKWEVAMEVLKFVALGISSLSGGYALLNDTKDKTTGTLTRSGRVVLGLLVTSSILAIAIQSLESKNTIHKNCTAHEAEEIKNVRDIENSKREQDHFKSIIETAGVASANAQNAATISSRVAGTLQHVSSEQIRNLEATWRAERPFGAWSAMVTLNDISASEARLNESWLDNVVNYAFEHEKDEVQSVDGSTIDLEIDDQNPLYPFQTISRDAIREPIRINFQPASHSDLKQRNFDQSRLTLWLEPTSTSLFLSISTAQRKVERINAIVEYSIKRDSASDEVTNFIDFYSNRVILYRTHLVSASLELRLGYKDTVAPHGARFEWTRAQWERDQTTNCDFPARNHCLTKVMTEQELGKFPRDYQLLFPDQFTLINKNLRKYAGTSILP